MIKKYYKNIFKLIGLLAGIIAVSYAWFYSKENSEFDNIAVRTNTANEILMSIDNGSTWNESLYLNLSEKFKFNNEITSNGIKFFKAANKRDDGTPITFQQANVDKDYLEFKILFKAKKNTGIFLDNASFVKPAVGTDEKDLIGYGVERISLDGNFSRDLIASAVRIAFIDNDYMNGEYTPQNITKLVWAPNKNYELLKVNDEWSFNLNSNNYQIYNYVDADENSYYYEKRVDNIKDNIKASYNDGNAYGDPMLTYINNDNETDIIKCLTIRIWIEGNDREAVTALKGGIFQMNLSFVGIEKENNNNIPNILKNGSVMIGYSEGMEYSSNFGNNWIKYAEDNNPEFSTNNVIWIRYEETKNNFASNYIELIF